MNDRSDPRLVRRYEAFASATSLSALAVGLSVLTGWTFHIAVLVTWGAGTPMAPNAAASTALASLSLWLLRKRSSLRMARARKLSAMLAAAVVGLVGACTLAEHLFGIDLGIDRLSLVTAPIVGARIRMSPVAAVVFVLFALALALIDWRTRRDDWPSQFFSLGAALGAAFGLFGLLLGPSVSPVTLAAPAVLCYFALACGIVCARSPWAVGGLLTSTTQGARLLRKVVPAGLLVLSLMGGWIAKPLLTEVHFTWIEVAAFAILCSSILAGFIAWIASIIDRGEAERKKLEAALRVGQEQIDRLLGRIEEPQTEARLRRKVRAGFAFAILLTGLLGVLSWHMEQQAGEDAAWVTHTHEVSTALESTLRHLLDVESGGRGFALSGNATFLGSYQTGKEAAFEDLQSLRLLLADNPEQQRRLDILEGQVTTRIEAAGDIVRLRQSTGEFPAQATLEHGKQLMDAVRATVAEMEGVEKQLLAQRKQRASTASQVSLSAVVFGSLVGVIFLSAAGFTLSHEIGISARARAQVDALNTGLERRVSERTAALGESEGRLAGVIQSAMDSIITVDEEQKIVLFNTAAERVFGCPVSEALGQPISRFIPRRFHVAHGEHIRKYGETGVTNRAMGSSNVLWALRSDGQEFQIEASISQAVTGGKKLFTVILRDVTERVRGEEVRERLAAIVESSDDAIIGKTLQGTITAWNHGAEKIFGYSSAEAVGKKMAIIIPTDLAPEEVDVLARVGRGESVEHFETVRVRKDGRKINVSVTISPIRDRDGTVVAASTIARDTTQSKRAEAELKQQQTELARSNRDLEQFAYAASHDLQEPLRAVAGCVNLLQGRYGERLDERAHEYMYHAVEGATRMQNLIDDLLSFSRVGTRGKEFQPVSCEEAVDNALKNLSVSIREKHGEIEHAPLPVVFGDLSQISLLFQNLIGSALKFSGAEAPRIRIGAQDHQKEWEISVRDNGIGIDPQYFERIFVIFQRLHTRKEYPGTGMGLALCKKIVERHGGRIWVESGSGKGATFRFTLPAP